MKTKMKQFCKRVIAVLCAALMVLGAAVSDVGTITARAETAGPTLWIVGDSTVCSFNDSWYYPRYGYGTQIGEYLDGTYTIRNLARSGRSSKSFLKESEYTTLTGENGIKSGDTLVIGFGHNDEKANKDLYTNPNGDYQTAGSFAKSLYDNYIKIAQDKGAEVIVCTPIVRRNPKGDILEEDDAHISKGSADFPGGDYPKAIRDMCSALSIPCVDLTAITKTLYEEIGKAGTLELHAWTTREESSADDTHLNVYGAKKVAWLFANAAKETTAALADHIDLSKGEPTKEKDLVSNPNYKDPENPGGGKLPDSTHYSDYVLGEGEEVAHFKGTAFGTGTDVANATIETDANGNMHISAKTGGITEKTDGIAMYYYKVPAKSQFRFTAKVTVNGIGADAEAAFGLMARDDMHIDEAIENFATPYVAAGSLGSGCNCFYRKEGVLGGKAELTTETVQAGGTYDLSIVTNTDGYECTFGSEPTQTGGYDFKLTSVDSKYVYVGMFASKDADVTFSDISLEIDGKPASDAGNGKIDVWDFGAKLEGDESIYNNQITPQDWLDAKIIHDGKTTIDKLVKGNFIGASGQVPFGDLTVNFTDRDRLYSGAAELAGINYGSISGFAATKYGDGYQAAGGWYMNGTGGAKRRYATIDNVKAGDKIIAYIGTHNSSDNNPETTFFFEHIGEGTQKEAVLMKAKEFQKCEFVAEYSGTYKIWENAKCKPMFHRIVRVPSVKVSGTIDYGVYQGTGHTLKFINQTTRSETAAVIDGNQFTANLTAGYTYTAVLSGAGSFGISSESKTVVTTDEEAVTGKTGVNLAVVSKEMITFSGKVTGFAAEYDVTKLAVTLTPPKDSNADTVDLILDDSLNFTASLEPDVKYTVSLSGVNDYEVKSPLSVEKAETFTEDIVVGLKTTYEVTGGFIGLDSAKVTSLKFENVDDKYVYTANVTDSGYSLKLRDGSYLAVAEVSGYSTKTHVSVSGAAAKKDLFFVSTAQKDDIPWVSDIYVGYPEQEHNYDTMREAMEACDLMKAPGVESRGEEQRITVHIAPGTYREQVFVNAPYVSFVNDTDKEVLLTWYYGIGYKYYSSDASGYYNPENAYDKFYKNGDSGLDVAKWGVSVYVKGTATGFRAEGITFESSFNRYITDEEIEDGVENAGTQGNKPERTYNSDVQSKAFNERAAAIVIDADQSEFKDCAFLSSQDTIGTGSANNHIYFKNCMIEGQTDYICGDSNVVFDACELRWKGYSDTDKGYGGYITAAKAKDDAVIKGYLFRNCVITANPELNVAAGHFGRPWGKTAAVTFMNTKLERDNLILPEGWNSMSVEPEQAYFREYNTTTLTGTAVDTSKRKAKVMTEAEAAQVKAADYFEGWVPYYYEEEEAEVAFATMPFITDNGDLNTPYPGHTLTVGYSLGKANDANDASVIQWYRVKDGKETLVKNSTALDKTYKIAAEDVGSNLKVVVTPTTVSGNTGKAESCTVEEAVREGYEDPDKPGDIVIGDGVNIFLAGDSTVKDYSAKGMNSGGTARDEGAWGEFFQNYFDEEKITVVNFANGGRSTRNFINEGTLDDIAEQIGEGDYLFIQFGHNDCSNGASYLPDRYVPLGQPDANGIYPTTPGTKVPTPAELADKGYGETCYTYDCGGTYKWYLKQYIDVAKNAGAIPVLVTPVSRMNYNSDGTIKPHHDATDKTTDTQTTSNNAYVTAVRQLAEEQDVLLVDGFELTKTLFEDAWKAGGNETYGRQLMHYDAVTGKKDGTHNNKLGGLIEAALIAGAVQDMDLNISRTVKAPSQVMGETTNKKTVFSVNAASKLTAFDINSNYAERAPYWEGVGQKLFDAIAEKNAELNVKEDLTDFALTAIGDKAYGDEAFTLSVTGEADGTGKVTYTSSDPSVISINGDTATILKAGEATITAKKAEDEKYNMATAKVNVTVNRKELSVIADSKVNIMVGSKMPKLTCRTDGLVNGDTFTDPVIQAEVDNTNTAGTYDIVISGGTLTNEESYNVTYVNGKLVIVEVPDRVAGYSRYETALKSADTFKELKGIDQFDAVVIAAGGAFPDALAGSTLAAAKNAPILLAGGSMNDDTNATLDYVKKNVKAGGEVYILGGTAAVSEEAEQQLKTDGYQVTRIAGTNRYETNLKLLENLDTPEGTDIIIASGSNYPDSIAVSGVAGAKGMPIILTNKTLNDEAIAKIKEIKPEHIYLIGGTSAVPEAVESQLQGLGQIQRIAGMNRYATSLEIAKAFGLQNAESAVIAYGNNFPDGLTGSVIAAELNAPIILVSDGSYQEQAEFIQNSSIESFYILGGTGVISDDTIKALLGV